MESNYIDFLLNKREENNRRLEELLQDEKVKEYASILKDSESIRILLRHEMENCDHVFVQTERVTSEEHPSGVRVFRCLKCGLTNEYGAKNISSDLSSDMDELYRSSFLRSLVIRDKIYQLGRARKLYQLIISSNPNISGDEMIEKFDELYKRREEIISLNRTNDDDGDKTKVKK